MDTTNFADRQVLLRLKREYSDNEIIKHLMDKNKQLEFEIGELRSEIAELRYENTNLKNRPRPAVAYRKDEYVQQLLDNAKSERERKIEFKKQVIEWRNKYFDLLARK